MAISLHRFCSLSSFWYFFHWLMSFPTLCFSLSGIIEKLLGHRGWRKKKTLLDLRQLPIVGWPKLPFLHTVLKQLRVAANNLQFLNVGPTLYCNNVDKVKQNQVSEIKFCHIYKYILAKRNKTSHKTCFLPVVNSLLHPYKWFGKYFMQYYHILLFNIPIFWWSCELTGLARPQSFVN